MKKFILICIFFVVLIISITMLSTSLYAFDNDINKNLSYEKLVGKDRYETSIIISKETYPRNAKNVILVNGLNNTDGIIAPILANKYSAPILLTPKDKLKNEIKEEIKRLNPKKVFIIGGDGVISDYIINELNNMGIQTERIYGDTRYTTSIEIAKRVKNFDKVIICNSQDNGVNASAISSIAAQNGIPILYNDSYNNINSITYNFIKNKVKQIDMIGNGMSEYQSKELKKKGIKIININSENSYDLNVKMLKTFNKKYNNVVLVNNSIDAISTSYLAVKNKSLLLYSSTNLTEEQKDLVRNNEILKIYYSGGGKIKGPVKDIINIFESKTKRTIEQSQLNLNKSKVVFYVPHQDDESSYFSQTIMKALKDKGSDNIYLVMISDGANSVVTKNKSVQKILKEKRISFTKARDNEFFAACKALGIKENNIMFNENLGLTRLKDGGVIANDVKSTMLYFEEKFNGDVTHITYSFNFETHEDHRQIGIALNELYFDLNLPENSFNSVYFIVRHDYKLSTIEKESIKMFTLNEINYGSRIIAALNVYKTQKLDTNNKNKIRIGIGYMSAPKVIDLIIGKVQNKTLTTNIHLPN